MNDTWLSLLSRCYARVDRRSSLLIATFHRIGQDSPLRVEHVKSHLSFLAENYDLLLPSQLATARRSKRSAMVTIDDCYQDAYAHIFPVAKSLHVPITICVPTDFFFRGKWLWFDMLKWAFNQTTNGREIHVEDRRIPVKDRERVWEFLNYLKCKTQPQRDRVIDQVLDALGVTPPAAIPEAHRPVSQTEMREMLGTGLVEICSHTVTHPVATQLSDDELVWETTKSKRELEEFCGHEVIAFCYPFGGAGEFDERTGGAIRDAGYKMAFTTIAGTNRSTTMNLFELKRVHAHRRLSVFEKQASGLSEIQRAFTFARSSK